MEVGLGYSVCDYLTHFILFIISFCNPVFHIRLIHDVEYDLICLCIPEDNWLRNLEFIAPPVDETQLNSFQIVYFLFYIYAIVHLQVKVFQSLQNAVKDNKEEGDAGTGGDTSLPGISSLCDLLTSYAALNTKHPEKTEYLSYFVRLDN